MKQWRSSGQSARAFADEHGLNLSTLKWWARQFPKQGVRVELKPGLGPRAAPAFAEVRVVQSEAALGRIEVVARTGVVVRVQGAVDAEALGRVLVAVLGC